MKAVVIYCHGSLTTATLAPSGNWRCTSCGTKVRVVT